VEIVSSGVTDVGRVRTNNEDSFRIVEAINLYVLSDGMGGEAHGEVASAMAVETISKYCQEPKTDSGVTMAGDTEETWSEKTRQLRNAVVQALVFMPGATDEFYMFRRARATITNNSPTLLDALEALTNQTRIRASFRAPLLLLHTDEDPLEPIGEIQDPGTEVKLEWTQFMAHAIYDDRDWDYLVPILSKKLKVRFSPARHSRSSWHFYRHSLAEWNLNGREALEAIALAGKTRFIVGHNNVNFSGDERYLERPKLDSDAVFGDRPVSK